MNRAPQGRRSVVHFVQQFIAVAKRRPVQFLSGLLFAAFSAAGVSAVAEDPWTFLKPIASFDGRDRAQIDERGIVLKVLPASGHELAVLAAGAIDVTPDAFVAATNDIAALKKDRLVPQIGRVSTEPRIEDVRQLTLDPGDIEAIRKCRPDDCDLKLLPQEIALLQQAASRPGDDGPGAIESAFRNLLVERAKQYLQHGDQQSQRQFQTLVQHSPYLGAQLPRLVGYLQHYPAADLPGVESFLYWSKETYTWKPMITVTHVVIVRREGEGEAPEVLVASRDIFSTRYTSGSFTVSMLRRDRQAPSKRYLVYVNRTWVDAVRWLWRPFIESRIKSQAGKVFAEVRARIERIGEREARAREPR
jgi:hypothetical protein